MKSRDSQFRGFQYLDTSAISQVVNYGGFARMEVRLPNVTMCRGGPPGGHRRYKPIPRSLKVSWWLDKGRVNATMMNLFADEVREAAGDKLYVPHFNAAPSEEKRLADFNALVGGSVVVVSDRVRIAVEAVGLTGFEFLPVTCIEYRPKRMQAFAPAELQGRVWELRPSLKLPYAAESGKQLQVICERCGTREVRQVHAAPMILDAGAWKGEDAFGIEGTYAFCVSDRFVTLARREGFTHVDFQPFPDGLKDETPQERFARWEKLNQRDLASPHGYI